MATQEWINACDLQAGDRIVYASGAAREVHSVEAFTGDDGVDRVAVDFGMPSGVGDDFYTFEQLQVERGGAS